jgi:hypothetical protein
VRRHQRRRRGGGGRRRLGAKCSLHESKRGGPAPRPARRRRRAGIWRGAGGGGGPAAGRAGRLSSMRPGVGVKGSPGLGPGGCGRGAAGGRARVPREVAGFAAAPQGPPREAPARAPGARSEGGCELAMALGGVRCAVCVSHLGRPAGPQPGGPRRAGLPSPLTCARAAWRAPCAPRAPSWRAPPPWPSSRPAPSRRPCPWARPPPRARGASCRRPRRRRRSAAR